MPLDWKSFSVDFLPDAMYWLTLYTGEYGLPCREICVQLLLTSNACAVRSRFQMQLWNILYSLQDEIYMFGGKLDAGSGNVTDELWVFNTNIRSWSLRTPNPVLHAQHFAVEGHSAHIMENRYGEPIMVVLFGYSPIYSYLSHVQEYNIRKY